jgi:hypothetical protein
LCDRHEWRVDVDRDVGGVRPAPETPPIGGNVSPGATVFGAPSPGLRLALVVARPPGTDFRDVACWAGLIAVRRRSPPALRRLVG